MRGNTTELTNTIPRDLSDTPAMQSPLRDEPSAVELSRKEEWPLTEHGKIGARVALAWGDTDSKSVTSSIFQDHHEQQPLSLQPQQPPATTSSTLSPTDGAPPHVQEPPKQQQQQQQRQKSRLSFSRITSAAALSAAPTGSTKRESLRAFGPLLRRAESIKNAPWAIALSSTRARDKRFLEQGIMRFNQKPAAGIELLISTGVLQRTPAEVAGFLRQHAGELSKKRIGEYVGSQDPFVQEVLSQLLQEYDFQGMAIDEAMRVSEQGWRGGRNGGLVGIESIASARVGIFFRSLYDPYPRLTFQKESCLVPLTAYQNSDLALPSILSSR